MFIRKGRGCTLAYHVVLLVCNWFFSLLVLPLIFFSFSFLHLPHPLSLLFLSPFFSSLPPFPLSLLFLLPFTPSCSPSRPPSLFLFSSLPFILSLPLSLPYPPFPPSSFSSFHYLFPPPPPPQTLPPSLSRSPSTDRSDLETSFSHNHAYLRDVASLDINSSEFGSLPAEVQHELLLERQQMEKYSYNDPATLPQVHKCIVALR